MVDIKKLLKPLENILNKFKFSFKRKEKEDKKLPEKDKSKTREEHSRGTILDAILQKRIAIKSPKIETAGVIVDRNKWAVVTIILSVALIISIISLSVQVNRFEKNMRILIVKLSPDGSYTTHFMKNRDMPAYFLNTLNSLIKQYVERRYSKHNDAITADYGFVYQFMSSELRQQFMNEYHAVKVAKDFVACTTCNQVDVKVDAVQHYESDDVVINARPDREYRSTVFVTVTNRNPDNSFLSKGKKIITLVWRIKSLAEMNKDIEAINADPIGLEILRASVSNEPHL